MSGISNTTVNLIGENELQNAEGFVRWKCIRLTSLFVYFVTGTFVSSSMIQKFFFCFNNFFWSLY